MCGIAGLVDPSRSMTQETLQARAHAMAGALEHRGPDDQGSWIDASRGVMLAHRRLSILDLSELGHQPMESATRRFVIAFNGEVYNFRALRRELERSGHGFRGHSDTEVILAAVEEWGVHQTLTRINGMFALAILDRHEGLLHLARDRIGEKPLYYGHAGGVLVFASQPGAIATVPELQLEIDPDALALFVRHGYVPAPWSIYSGIKKLLPGNHLTHNANRVPAIQSNEYWALRTAVDLARAERVSGELEEVIDELDVLLRDAVALRMIADVPLGAMLSGGIDSSLIVALMQGQSSSAVRTFSIGFSEATHDEAPHARAVAAHLGTSHTELYVSPHDAMSVIPRLPSVYDEPFADSSQIPTLLVSQLARRDVTVALSGDGGDELFGGYTRYLHAIRLHRRSGWLPPAIWRPLSRLVRSKPPQWWDETWRRSLGRMLPNTDPRLGHRVDRLADLLDMQDPGELYLELISYWRPMDGLLSREGPIPPVLRHFGDLSRASFAERMMFVDSCTYLPDDILAKVDRASMAVGLEARVPLLDHRVVQFAWSLPTGMRVQRGQSKLLLRRLLHRYVPPKLVERPKMGFGVPIDDWLREPLREWAESLLSPTRLRSDGYFNPHVTAKRWHEHLEGSRSWHYHLWPILMFNSWLDAQPSRLITTT